MPAAARPSRLTADRLCLAAAFAVTLVWFTLYAGFAAGALCDEDGHLEIVNHFAAHKPGWPDTMTTPPGYHLTVIALGFGHPTLTTARATTALFACLALAAFAGAWQKFHGRHPGPVTLLVALLPIFQPFTALAYSDAAGLAVILGAWWAQLADRRLLAAFLFILACLVRQTNAVWGVFFLAFDFSRELRNSDLLRAALTTLRRNVALVAVLALAAGTVLWAGRVTPGTNHGNQVQPNLATLHFAGVLAFVLLAPLWLAHAREIRSQLSFRRAAVLLAAAAVLALSFSNPHVWNRELWWPGVNFTLLRNWPLVWIDAHPWLRAVSGLNLALLAAALVFAFHAQRHRTALWLALAFGALIPATNGLVEPRYFITPFVFVFFFLEWSAVDLRRLTLWFAFLCAVHAPFIVAARSLW